MIPNFRPNPVKALENLLGVDLPDDQRKTLTEGVKANLSAEKRSGALGGIFKK